MSLSKILSDRPETQAVLAAAVGVFQTTISAWKRGASLPPSTRIPSLAAALGMSLDDLKAVVAKDRAARKRRALAGVVRGAHTRNSTRPVRA